MMPAASTPTARIPAALLESARLPSDTGEAPVLWFCLTLVVAILLALLVGVLIGAIVGRIGRRRPLAVCRYGCCWC